MLAESITLRFLYSPLLVSFQRIPTSSRWSFSAYTSHNLRPALPIDLGDAQANPDGVEPPLPPADPKADPAPEPMPTYAYEVIDNAADMRPPIADFDAALPAPLEFERRRKRRARRMIRRDRAL